MRKVLVVALVIGLLGAMVAAPATAKKKKKAKAKSYTLYLHGTEALGEQEIPDRLGVADFKPMSPKKPEDAAPKSMFVTNYVAGPNSACSGNNLFPTWGANVAGTFSGDITVFLNAATHPGNELRIDIFADATGGCESTLGSTGYVPPVASETVSLDPGLAETKVVFKKVKFKTVSSLAMMVTPAGEASQARLLYDSPDFASRILFRCAPRAGKSCLG